LRNSFLAGEDKLPFVMVQPDQGADKVRPYNHNKEKHLKGYNPFSIQEG
jgi:hypothetical protein